MQSLVVFVSLQLVFEVPVVGNLARFIPRGSDIGTS